MSPWLTKAVNDSSVTFFNKPPLSLGMGGSIPLLGELGEKYTKAQFVTLGVLGPEANAHGPNEFLHIDFVKKLMKCIVYQVAESY